MTLYKQFTPEGCLPVCLMNLNKIKSDKEKEIEFLSHAFRSTKFDYALGNLDFFSSRYGKGVIMIVGNKKYASFLRSINKNPRVSITGGNISKNTIEMLLAKGRLIIYLDAYFAGSDVHIPHFAVVERAKGKFYEILDPWDGKVKTLTKSKILKGVNELKRRFYFAPKLIQVVNK